MELLLGRSKIGVDGKKSISLDGRRLRGVSAKKSNRVDRVASFAPRHEEAAAAGRGEYRFGDECHE